jgi:hypothetical protein
VALGRHAPFGGCGKTLASGIALLCPALNFSVACGSEKMARLITFDFERMTHHEPI